MQEAGKNGRRGAWANLLADDLGNLLAAARQLPAEELPAFLAALEEVKVTGLSRLLAPATAQPPDQLLDAGEAAARLGVSRDYLHRHHDEFPFTRRIGRRLLFSSLEIGEWIRRQGSLTARRQSGRLPVVHQRKGEPA